MSEPQRTWMHQRKGRITGVIVGEVDEWLQIELCGDHRLNYAAEDNQGRVDEDGHLLTVRKSFLTEVTDD